MPETALQISARRIREFADEQLLLADNAWINELSLVFHGKNVNAMAALPEGRGELGSRLRELFDARVRATQAWHATREGA